MPDQKTVAEPEPKTPEPPASLPVLMGRVLADIPAVGKNSKAPSNMGGYDFRGIEDVLAALKPAMARHGVFCIPNVKERVLGERPVSGNKTMFVVDLFIEWTFYGPAGDSLTATCWGQGTDMGDKSHQKAMTSGFKSMLMQTFCIGDAGSDAEAHSVPDTDHRQEPQEPPPPKAEGWATAEAEASAHKAVAEQIKQLYALIPEDHPVRDKIKAHRDEQGWPMAAGALTALSVMVARATPPAQEETGDAQPPQSAPEAAAPAPGPETAAGEAPEMPWENLPTVEQEAAKLAAGKPICPWCEKPVIGPKVMLGGKGPDDPVVNYHKTCHAEKVAEEDEAG